MFQLIVAVIVSALPMVAAVTPARADNAATLLGLVNALRASNGVGALAADPTLTTVAQAWSAHMASGYGLSHNPSVSSQVSGGWTILGENVGRGGNLTSIFNAFVNSPFHLSNMIDPSFNLTGIAVAVDRQKTLWVTQDFEAKPGATAVTTTLPRASTTTTTSRPRALTSPTGGGTTTTTRPAPPRTTPTSAPPSVPTTAGGVTGIAGLVPGLESPPTSAAPPPSIPVPLAAAASLSALSAHGNAGGSLRILVLTLSVLAMVAVTGAAFFINKLLRPTVG